MQPTDGCQRHSFQTVARPARSKRTRKVDVNEAGDDQRCDDRRAWIKLIIARAVFYTTESFYLIAGFAADRLSRTREDHRRSHAERARLGGKLSRGPSAS